MPELKMSSCIHMYPSGKLVDPLDLQPEDIDVTDIAYHIGAQCRFSGGVKDFYSVGQHSVLASYIVPPEFAWDALFHDAAEAYLQDMARPLKAEPYFGKAYRGAEMRVEKVIGEVLDVVFPMPPEVKEADEILLVTEARDLKHGTKGWEHFQDVKPLKEPLKAWSPRQSRTRFLARYNQLSKLREEVAA